MLQAAFISQAGGGGKQLPIRNGGVGAGQLELRHIVAVGAGPLCDYDIPQAQVGMQRAGAAKADDIFHIIEVEQLIAVNTDGGDAHAVSHYRDRHPAVCAGVAQHSPDGIIADRGLQVVFGHELGAQRVARHQHRRGDLALLGSVMGSRHQ